MKPSETNISTREIFNFKLLKEKHRHLIERENKPVCESNGVFDRFEFPILTAAHTPLHWRYDLNRQTNPFGMERFGINATFNPGAIKWKDKYLLAVRVEGADRKSFIAIAESPNGFNRFEFWDSPILIPQNGLPDTNVYDMRLVVHEDGWIYGIFCTERKDPKAPKGDTSSAVANAGIVRSKDLINWERLPDLISNSSQQRNVVLHPEFVNGKYAVYTRPQDEFIEVGSGGGIGIGYIDHMENPVVQDEIIMHQKMYHTIYELKNGLGPAPIKTREGWLHLAHGVRNTAAGLRYTLYLFMTDLQDISKITHLPGGYFMAPNDEETVGDVSNVLFSCGWIRDEDETVFIYYASSDTRCHVAVSSTERLIDYVKNTPEDRYSSAESVKTVLELIFKNKGLYS
ncbi:MAG: glycosidase [Flavobacteriales bacterium CG_4_9_14_3_um_filter_40_17]|nr:MAG: glycosidase [Flavobacteriales bacterium CG_4_9_14_3_um_filter_40_17]